MLKKWFRIDLKKTLGTMEGGPPTSVKIYYVNVTATSEIKTCPLKTRHWSCLL
jgi:hypothetical protein